MKKEYGISSFVILVLTYIVFCIMFINENESWATVPVMFALAAFLLSFPSSIVSRKIIKVGDNIKETILKILFYVVLPIALVGISIGVANLLGLAFQYFLPESDLGQAIIMLFWIMGVVMAIVLPYIQSIIVLILRKIIRK